ncbi:hypothetical protein M501DRAFT_1011389 [Patellaria atrata CBS 101060]|uniref:RPAP1-like protein n=1 Tax=Patellaria atrata CBS 101060 TaxID=1346257 RepID=A0A9P4VPA0_9PEZI|nr:hypothetical protein M501DRAFT_1011389 [Patellaria atrata CBS 101060]
MSNLAKGQRFIVDLDDSDHEQDDTSSQQPSAFSFVSDVKERAVSEPKTPTAPTLKSTGTGSPAHKKRFGTSAFKRQRVAISSKNDAQKSVRNAGSQVPPAPKDGTSFAENERRQIDQENSQRLADMSPEEIERERQELFSSLDPSHIEKLLRRANLNDGSNERNFYADTAESHVDKSEQTKPQADENETTKPPKLTKTVTFEESEETAPEPDEQDSPNDEEPVPSIHFPAAPQPPPLDPTDPNFLQELHEKYFPDLPHDPSKLAWMAPLPTDDSIADRESTYHPSQRAVHPSSLRFSFNGALLPPRLSRQIPVTAGLHHHADAPEAAGYTISELARLGRSAVASQRCVAYQTLGRILYRLGIGEFGEEEGGVGVDPSLLIPEERAGGDSGAGAELARGLWELVEKERILDILQAEANKETGHLSARVYAQEAVWNWRKGGGRKRKAV